VDATSTDLRAERARLEDDIARLRTALARATADLDVARERGPRPRGLGWGIALAVVVIVGLVAWAFAGWVHFMSHYG
jgi:hypothetical protein